MLKLEQNKKVQFLFELHQVVSFFTADSWEKDTDL